MEQSPFTYTMFVNDISVTEFNYGTPENNFQDSELMHFLKWYKNLPDSISPYNDGLLEPKYPYTNLVFSENISISDFNYGSAENNFSGGDLSPFLKWYITLGISPYATFLAATPPLGKYPPTI